MTGDEFDPVEFARQTVWAGAQTDEALSMLETRITALEEIVAARWPRRILVQARLGRALRRSVAPYRWMGPKFADRRLEAVHNDWLGQ